MEVWLNTFLILFTVGGITILANLAEKQKRLQVLLVFAILGMNGLILLYTPLVALAPAPDVEPPETEDIVAAGVLAVLTAVSTSLLLLQPIREWLAHFFPQPTLAQTPYAAPDLITYAGELEMASQTQVLPERRGFNPDSMVHMWGLILCLQFMGLQFVSFFLVGGISGVAEDIGVDYSSLVAGFIPTFLIPLLGVGLFIRRNPRQILERIAIRPLSLERGVVSVGVAMGATFVLVLSVAIVGGIWATLVSEDTLEAQTEASEALAASVDSIGLALMVALTAAIGEEIAFRGVLQPIFGFWFTAIVFVLSHSQYLLTPATLIILIVAMGLGLIRKYFDTSTAILTHFLYNFTLLLLSLAAQDLGFWTYRIL